jgi:AraC-like DNA-binding protein
MKTGVIGTEKWEQLARQAEFDVGRMAAICAISERHLQRVFKKHFQRTPSRWIRELQCRLAKQLISQGYSSKAAAAELNFATESHFCREFKKVHGSSPQCFAPQESNYLRLLELVRHGRPDLVSGA